MGTQVRVFDRFGVPLVDLDCFARRSWKLNGMGKAIFRIAKTDPRCAEVNLRFGNLVLVEHDGVGRWGGVIDPPRHWNEGEIEFTAYTPELLLKYSVLWNPVLATDETAGYRFEGYLYENFEERHDREIFELGTVFKGGTTWDDVSGLQDFDCYKKLREFSDKSGQDWEFLPRFRGNGNLYFECNWHESLGSTYDDIIVEEGKHINIKGGTVFSEQGEIANQIYAYWPDDTSYEYSNNQDAESEVFYGERWKRYSITFTNYAAVNDWINEKLSEMKNPRRTFNISVVNDGDIFSYLGVGNTVGLQLVNYGFTNNALGIETTVRVKSREYAENDGFMSLVVEEV
jgi:hypothetical protein